VRYGCANDLTEETEKMRYDFITSSTGAWLDLRIILETLGVLIDRRSHQRPGRAWRPMGAGSERHVLAADDAQHSGRMVAAR
jgi:hypothetical protein